MSQPTHKRPKVYSVDSATGPQLRGSPSVSGSQVRPSVINTGPSMPGLAQGPSVPGSPHAPTVSRGSKTKLKPVKASQIWLLFRRFLVLIAVIVYINNELQCVLCAFELLGGVVDHTSKYDQASYIASFVQPSKGDISTVGKGKLVNQVLNMDITPRINATLYLHSPDNASYQECDAWPSNAHQRMYGNSYLRQVFNEVRRDIPRFISELVGTEVVVPIVDCSFTGLQKGDRTFMRMFYLMRKTNSTDVNDTFLLTYSLSMQDYRYPDLHQLGSTASVTISVVSNLTADHVVHYNVMSKGSPFRTAFYVALNRTGVTDDGYLILDSIPAISTTGDTTFQISARTGIYRSTEAEQGSIVNWHWEPSSNPLKALSEWQWYGISVRKDTWAWVHGLHLIFAIETMFNLIILLIVVYHSFRKGKVWIGDAFVSISKSSLLRAVLILLAWQLNGFWTVHKFVLSTGDAWGNVTTFLNYSEMMHGDMMIIYLGVINLLGYVTVERISPSLSVLLFEVGFAFRHEIATLFPSIVSSLVAFAEADYMMGLVSVVPKLAMNSPLRLASTHPLSYASSTITCAALLPIFLTLIFLNVYIPVRKLYHYFYPEQIWKGSIEDENPESKSSLTTFEIATGAALQNRVGLVSSYKSCIYIKGMRFASADGIYSNGFVCVHHKYLIRTSDIWLLLVILISQVRVCDLYVYEIDGYTVQKTAHLFYPEMITWKDVFYLHSMVLL